MPIALDQLPDDIDVLKSLVADQAARDAQLTTENQRYKTQVLILTEQLNLAQARRYAASSEKISPNQILMFDEAETAVEVAPDMDDEILVPAHKRKKRGRKPLPDNLPRVDVVHEIPESTRHCDHDGRLLVEIGEVISEQLDIIPAKIQVIRHICKKYACNCGQCIKTATLPAKPIPRSMASPGLLAHITVSKYQDALPLYRQETILQRIGIGVEFENNGLGRDNPIYGGPNTLGNWSILATDIKVSSYPLYGLSGGLTAPVPVPAAVWLFSSDLLGLIGIARRKKTS